MWVYAATDPASTSKCEVEAGCRCSRAEVAKYSDQSSRIHPPRLDPNFGGITQKGKPTLCGAMADLHRGCIRTRNLVSHNQAKARIQCAVRGEKYLNMMWGYDIVPSVSSTGGND